MGHVSGNRPTHNICELSMDAKSVERLGLCAKTQTHWSTNWYCKGNTNRGKKKQAAGIIRTFYFRIWFSCHSKVFCSQICLDPRPALHDCRKAVSKTDKNKSNGTTIFQMDMSGVFPHVSLEIHVDAFKIRVHNSNKEHVHQQVQRNSWPRLDCWGKRDQLVTGFEYVGPKAEFAKRVWNSGPLAAWCYESLPLQPHILNCIDSTHLETHVKHTHTTYAYIYIYI